MPLKTVISSSADRSSMLQSLNMQPLFFGVTREIIKAKSFYFIFILFLASSLAATHYYNDSLIDPVSLYLMRPIRAFINGAALIAILLAAYMIFSKSEDKIGALRARLAKYSHVTSMILPTVLAIFTYVVFLGCFLYWKMKIPQFNAFDWDETFARADAVLLGGYQGWELLPEFLFYAPVLKTIDTIYVAWALAGFFFWIGLVFLKRIPDELKCHYWLTNIVSWIFIGLFAATAMASAGPAYYHHFSGDTELFAGLMGRLEAFDPPLKAVALQEMLWQIHSGNWTGIGGISAMPSMHNAQAMIYFLLAMHLGRVYQFLMAGLLVFTFIGSFLLGWHYVVDGLVAFVLVLPIWYICGKVTNSNLKKSRKHSEEYLAELRSAQ